MHVRFCGVRGSVPWATPGANGVGSNTPCLHVWDELDRRFLILDAGTGIVSRTSALDHHRGPLTVLLSHYHWDHVQGLPFFPPLYERDRIVSVAGPALMGVSADWLKAIFSPPYFPLPLADVPSPPSVGFINAGPFTAGGFAVEAVRLSHPGDAFAYRIAGAARDLVYATDHEFGDPLVDAELARFAAGAGALVLDAHYTPEELPAMRGRGHSSWRQCAEFAASCGVGQLWLFHHQPGRTDDQLQAITEDARRIFPGTALAAEGVAFAL
jgi:ribonuclease BN (tRNA processing enzyme)